MSTPLRRLARLVFGGHTPARMLGGFVDSLLQTFENCRPGLADGAVDSRTSVEEYFARLYEKEKPRLVELVDVQYSHLSGDDRRALVEKIESRIQDVVVPAYSRLAARFTARERNDFYVAPGAWHGLERIGFAVAGMVLGFLCIKASFVPIWADEWVLVFAFGGLVFPELRRLLAWKRYESEINTLVERTDDEIFRMDLALLTHEPSHVVTSSHSSSPEHPQRTPPRAREGGR